MVNSQPMQPTWANSRPTTTGLVQLWVGFFLLSDHEKQDIPALQIRVWVFSKRNRMRGPQSDGNNTTTTEPCSYCLYRGDLRPKF